MEKILELNLIRNRMNVIESRRQHARYSRIFFVFAAVVFLIITFNSLMVAVKNWSLIKEYNSLQTDIADKRKAYDVKSLEKQWREYIWKLKTINSMLNDRSLWGNRLKELANMLPPGMCISNITVAEEQGGRSDYRIELKVLPQSDQKGFKQVDGYVNAIETNKYFGKGVKLLSHERQEMNKKEIEIFQVLLSSGLAK
jgi:hypothetical protein